MPSLSRAQSDAWKYFKSKYSWLTFAEFNALISNESAFKHSQSSWFGGYENYEASDEFIRWADWKEQYMKSIARYQGTSYYNLLQNNPYLGFQSGLDTTAWNERVNSAQNEMYKVLGVAQENQYNSTAAAAERDAQAGFNPALTGQLAGTQPGASAAPSDARPTAGISPDAQLAADVQERQNSFDRAYKVSSLPLDFITSISSGLDAFTRLMKSGAEVSGLLASAGASSAAAALSTEQAAGQKASNQNVWRSQFLDTLLGGLDLSSGSVNIADRIAGIDRSAWTPEQAAYFDSLNDSGYFAGPDGSASAAAMQEYAARLSGTSQNLFSAGQNIARVGGFAGLADPSAAVSRISNIFGQYELDSMRLELESQVLQNRYTSAMTELNALEQLKTEQETVNLQQTEDLLVSETMKAQNEAQMAEIDRRIKERTAEVQRIMLDIQENDARRERLRSESYSSVLDFAEKSDNAFVKWYAARMLRTADDSNRSLQDRQDRGLNNLSTLVGMMPKTPKK